MTRRIFLLGESEKITEEVTVIVPGFDVLLTEVVMPALSKKRLQQALPFKLEEKLLDDVSGLHFAMGEAKPNPAIFVAIVAKQKMVEWINALNSVNTRTLVPSMLALPFSKEAWHIAIYDSIGIVRTGKYSGFTVDKENLDLMLNFELAQTAETPSAFYIYNFTKTSLALTLKSFSIHETFLERHELVTYFNRWMEETPAINLLQSPYRVKNSRKGMKKTLTVSCVLVTFSLLILFSSRCISYFVLQKRNHTLNVAITHIYKKYFPEAHDVIAPRLRLESVFRKLTVGTQENPFLVGLHLIGESMHRTPGIDLSSLAFKEPEFYLTVSAVSIASLDSLVTTLTQKKLNAKLEKVEVQKNKVFATLIIGTNKI